MDKNVGHVNLETARNTKRLGILIGRSKPHDNDRGRQEEIYGCFKFLSR